MIYINRPIMIYINRPIMIYINRPIMIYFLICSFNVFFIMVFYYGVLLWCFIMVFYYGVYNFKLYFFINVYKI